MIQSEVGDVTIYTERLDEAADKWMTWVTGGTLDGLTRTYGNEADSRAGHDAVTQQVVEAEGKGQTG